MNYNFIRKIILAVLLFVFTLIQATVPVKFRYQAVLRDANGKIIANTQKDVLIEIVKGNMVGEVVFREQHNVTTLPTGLMNIVIGSVDSVGLANVKWDNSDYFIRVSLDGIELGTTQILSVPYSLFSKNVLEENQKLSISQDSTKLSIDGTGGNSIDISNWILNKKNTLVLNNINPNWTGWNESRLVYGIDKNTVPVPIKLNSQLIVPGTIIAGGSNTNSMRWGYHVFEGYAADNISRITMIVNKHTEENKNVAEMYYYKMGYSHTDKAYQWIKIGSDVKQHSFMFSRDKAISYGLHDFRNVITLARINPDTDIITTYKTVAEVDAKYDPEINYVEHTKCMLYLSLKNAPNGSMFYDTVKNKVVVKVNGSWKNVVTEDIPASYYNF